MQCCRPNLHKPSHKKPENAILPSNYTLKLLKTRKIEKSKEQTNGIKIVLRNEEILCVESSYLIGIITHKFYYAGAPFILTFVMGTCHRRQLMDHQKPNPEP